MAALSTLAPLDFDLRAGNVATIEVVLVLLAIAYLAAGRILTFSLLTVAASLFKILPATFLLLLLLSPRPRARRTFLLGSVAVLVIFGLPLVFYPQYLRGFTKLAGEFSLLRGPVDSSLFAFTRDATAVTGTGSDAALAAVANVLPVGVILFVCIRVYRALRDSAWDRLHLLWFLCVVYGIISPRMITYSLSLFLLPTYLLLARLGWS